MESENLIQQFLNRFGENFGAGFDNLSHDLQQQLKSAAQSAFSKMELVTRDEFDAQQAVLLRTRQKLEALEKQIAELEQLASTQLADK